MESRSSRTTLAQRGRWLIHAKRLAMSGERRLCVTLWQCKDLANKDGLMGMNDPHVELSIGAVTHKSETIEDAGSKARWKGGSRHTFEATTDLQEKLKVRVLDDDMSGDDLIGETEIDLSWLAKDPDRDKSRGKWFKLKDGDGKPAGSVRLQMTWAAPLEPAATEIVQAGSDSRNMQQRRLRATVWQCSDLVNKDGLMGKNDPYVELSIGDESYCSEKIDDAGDAVKWGGGSSHVFQASAEELDTLEVRVMDDDAMGRDELIGKLDYKLDDLLEDPDRDQQLDEVWLPLETEKGKDAGKILLQLTWAPLAEEVDPPTPTTKISNMKPEEGSYEPSAGGVLDGMTLEQAAAYCARLPGCHGMWFTKEVNEDTPSRCEPLDRWDNSSLTHKPEHAGALYQIRGGEMEPIAAKSRVDSQSICFFSSAPLPAEGQGQTHLYAEVTFTRVDGDPEKKDMANDGFFGLTNHDTPQRLNDLAKRGAWGFKDDRTKEGIRVGGSGKGQIPLNEDGRGYSAEDQLGLLIDLDHATVQLYRNGQLVEGAVSSGWDRTQRMWLAACVPSAEWIANWSFPKGFVPCEPVSLDDEGNYDDAGIQQAVDSAKLKGAEEEGMEQGKELPWKVANVQDFDPFADQDDEEEDELCVHPPLVYIRSDFA